MRTGRVGLLVALGVDNFGSGLFLPVALLYVTRVVGLPLATAGTVVALGSAAGLAVPAVAGRLVDRVGSWRVVVGAQVAQAAGAVAYLAASGVVAVAVAAVLLAAGQQLFYSSLFALIADVSGEGPKDRPFAVAAMVRSACFSLGGLSVGGLLTVAGTAGCRIAVVVNAVSFGVCAVLLAVFVRVPSPPRRDFAHRAVRGGVWSDRPFLAVITAAGLAVLASDFYLSGMSVYMIGELRTRPWVPGTALAMWAGLISVGATAALRATRHVRRTTAMSAAAGLYVAACAACAAALVIPSAWRPAELLAATVVMAVAGLLFQRANALAEAVAPAAARGRYLAAFQYAFTVAAVIAPGMVALFSVAVWLPWLLVGGAAALAVVVLRWAAGRLPAEAQRPGRVVAAGASPVSRA
jgi:Na+/melibiose symporter-like transporter